MPHPSSDDLGQKYIEALLLLMVGFLAFALIGASLGAHRSEKTCDLSLDTAPQTEAGRAIGPNACCTQLAPSTSMPTDLLPGIPSN